MSITKIKRKNKTIYQARVCIKGVRLKSKVFATKALAYDWHDREKERLKDPKSAHKKELSEMLFKDVLYRYEKERLPQLANYTQRNYRKSLRLYFKKDFLLSTKMCNFSSEVVDQWLAWLLRQPAVKRKNRKTFRQELKFLNNVLNWYRNYVHADFHVPIVKRHRDRCFYKKLPSRRPDYFARPKEVKAWIRELKKCSNPVYWKLAQFMVLTGARVSEACGLMWQEVDLEKRFARIVRTTCWESSSKKPYLLETTKTNESARLLMLPQEFADLLKAMKEESLSELVFFDRKGDLLKYNTVKTVFDNAFKRLGLSWRGTHICRHTYATMALMATRDLSAVQASLGHTDQKMTQRYAKAVALLNSETAEKTAKIFDLD